MIKGTKPGMIFLGLLIGVLVVLQIRSFQQIGGVFVRDTRINAFQEINILKTKNEALKKEIADLEDLVLQFSDQTQALVALDTQILKYRTLDGDSSVYGPGLSIYFNANIDTPWMTDLVNAFFYSGAEAVAVNGIRITDDTAGFDALPQGQILLNGSIVSAPFTFELIGESSEMSTFLEVDGGILSRLKASFPGIDVSLAKKDIIQMN
jgi:uncharacterized protein YlxW (UPF0749 family)